MNNTLPFGQAKKKQPTYTNDSILEALRGIGGSVGGTVAKDVVGKVATNAISSVLGAPRQGDLHVNEPIKLSRESQPTPYRSPLERHVQTIREDQVKVEHQIEAVRTELKALAVSIKNFHSEIQKAIEEMPPDPGIYHLNFLERLRGVLRILREQIEDSRSWLALTTNKKKKKQYWGLYKKHGTQFGLSSERTMATQAG